MRSLEKWRDAGYAHPVQKTLLRDTLIEGYNQLGVLFIYRGGAYWYGSTLTLEHARDMAPFNSATTLQVAAGIIGALDWMMRHPEEGVVEAETIDHEEVLSVARPYLGEVRGYFTDWQPGKNGDLSFSVFRVDTEQCKGGHIS